MSNMSDYVLRGTVVEWGGYVKSDYYVYIGEGAALQKVTDALKALGRFSGVRVSQLSGYVFPYISITATSTIDRGQLQDVLLDIEGAISGASYLGHGFRPDTQAFWVKSAPVSSQPNVAQASYGQNAISPASDGKTPVAAAAAATVAATPTGCPQGYEWSAARGLCVKKRTSWVCDEGYEWSWGKLGCIPEGSESSDGPIDDLANSLGVTPTQAALIGAVGVLLVLAVIKKAL